MNRITHPLAPESRGPLVADLQLALVLMLSRAVIFPRDPETRAQVVTQLATEAEQQVFGQVTQGIVAAFQTERRLPGNGAVDEATAREMNALLEQWGVLSDARRHAVYGTPRCPQLGR